jgi:DNA-binding transcriptional MocR family regulator
MTQPSPFAVRFRELGPPRYEQLAEGIERAIRERRLQPGDRLPPLRQLADDLDVSVTTVAAAFNLLSERKLIRAEVGRGTFVSRPEAADASRLPPVASVGATSPIARAAAAPWRRRALMMAGARLRTRYPNALDCSTGRPDVALLPLEVLRRAWKAAITDTSTADLQYAGPNVIDALVHPLLELLADTGAEVGSEDLLIGSSAQQWMMLALEAVKQTSGDAGPVVAVEEPGYPTIIDAYERAGARVIGVAVDRDGAVPESLDAVFRAGAAMALLTPRAHNPTGATWSPQRVAALAAVLKEHPNAVVVEDDHFAEAAATHPGSLLADERVSARVVYIRSFSKLIAPDLRIAAAVARPRLRGLLAEARSFSDGWTSRLLQKTLAIALRDDKLKDVLRRARDMYQQRRVRAADALNAALLPHGGGTLPGADGLNVWVQLPPDVDAMEVLERAAAGGVRIAPGEPFFIRPGQNHVVRLNAGSVPAEEAHRAGRIVAEAALASGAEGPNLIHV